MLIVVRAASLDGIALQVIERQQEIQWTVKKIKELKKKELTKNLYQNTV